MKDLLSEIQMAQQQLVQGEGIAHDSVKTNLLLLFNQETIEAMKAARAGDTKKFDSLDALMADLHADD